MICLAATTKNLECLEENEVERLELTGFDKTLCRMIAKDRSSQNIRKRRKRTKAEMVFNGK